jgi:CDP-glycerol glycerophosphotransferase (TagB/SpsB family)
VVVKLHPIGAGKEFGYEVAIAEHPTAPVRVTREEDLYDLIGQCDCVVTHGSSVAIEAASFGVPTILLSPGGAPDVIPLVAEGVALRAVDIETLAACIEQLKTGEVPSSEAFERFDRRFALTHDGRAGERIADVCEELAHDRQID